MGTDGQLSRNNLVLRMNSIGPECNKLKAKYDSCFNVWFSEKFLKGDSSDDMCKPLFVLYRDCVRAAISKENISLTEVDKTVLGTEEEKQPPPVSESSLDHSKLHPPSLAVLCHTRRKKFTFLDSLQKKK